MTARPAMAPWRGAGLPGAGALLRRLLRPGPVLVIFAATNAANAGNMIYNMLFSRWMGPELFGTLALLLTIKLAVLSVLNAVQMAASQRLAGAASPAAQHQAGAALAVLGRGLTMAMAVVAGLGLAALALGVTGLPGEQALAAGLLLAALPLAVPLSLGRGRALGRLAVRAIAGSTLWEMALRLGGGAAAWLLGLGLPGVAAALGLALLAGWLPLRRLPACAAAARPAPVAPELRAILALALPLAGLQLAQVALMDGDVLIAPALLGAADTGLAAVLALVQRIQFFACFGLAGVLLPAVTAAVARGESGLAPLLPVLGLVVAVSGAGLAVALLAPGAVIALLAGPGYGAAAPLLPGAMLAAVCFTLSYLGATVLAAWQDRAGLALMLAGVALLAAGYALLAWLGADGGLGALVALRAGVHLLLALAVLARLGWQIINRAGHLHPQPPGC